MSNRLPVSVRRVGSQRTVVRSSGGLVAGLGPVHDAGDSLWIGNLDAGDLGPLQAQLTAQRLVPVPLTAEDSARHYEGYSNRVLWPLCHYLLEHVAFDGPDYEAYARVNRRFAEVVAAHARPDDTIWIHDYHLMLLPGLLRARLPQATLGFFLHVPFPSSEVFRILPRKEEILTGLLGANLIGLHTADYARHLVTAFRRILRVRFDDSWRRQGDDSCQVGVFPLGVDVAQHAELARRPAVVRRVQRLQRQVQGRRVILGVDRMDYTKGLPERLTGFSRLLASAPRWRRQVALWQLAVPSRANLDSYRALKETIDRRVGEINGAYQSGGFTPIFYMYRSVPPEELAALYRLADIALVTPTRDGMNLVAKEYIASRTDDSGVLILSEFAGAATELREALLINPHDPGSITAALRQALLMAPTEVATRMQALRRRVAEQTVHDWVRQFRRALAADRPPPAAPPIGVAARARADLAAGVRACAVARRVLLALDYDGTLAELVPDPAAAAPTAAVRAVLARLASLPDTTVLIISGRDPVSLGTWLGDLPVHLIAEHGFHERAPGAAGWRPRAATGDLAWQPKVRAGLELSCRRTPGSFIENKPVSLVWHYRRADPELGAEQARELVRSLQAIAAAQDLLVLHGDKVVEVRPSGCDKGRALVDFIAQHGPFDWILAAGDDRTDEDMFAVLDAEAWTIRVGSGAHPSRAQHRLPDPSAVLDWLTRLAESRAP